MGEKNMKILILGGDNRYQILTNQLKKDHEVKSITNQTDFQQIIPQDYQLIIFPITGLNNQNKIKYLTTELTIPQTFLNNIPTTTTIYTGLITPTLKEQLPDNPIISFLQDEEVKKENNQLTVEGILDKLNEQKRTKICILGYGNIAKLLHQNLANQNIIFGIKEIQDKQLLKEKAFYTTDQASMIKTFQECDYIINTVPENIITTTHLHNSNAEILDIASSPYGANHNVIQNYPKYHIYPQIPASYSKERAGNILYKKLTKDLGGK